MVQDLLSNIGFYGFAVFNWFLYLFLGLRSGTFFTQPTEQQQLQHAIARDQFWNLSKAPLPGFKHGFFKLRNGLKLHYIYNREGNPSKQNGNLVIFIHGFPDSCMVWRSTLKEPAIPFQSATLVCVDLPGYGGSDSFKKHDCAVLEALVEFVIGMREEYIREDPVNPEQNTIIVAHDWGCAIAFRLAAEAPCLADRFILTNGPHVELSLANKDRVLQSSSKIFKQFQQSPTRNFSCLSKAFRAFKPVLLQALLFGYIFAFHLPSLLVKYLGSGGNKCFLRGALKSAHGAYPSDFNAQESLAATLGPGILEIETTTASGEGFGVTVAKRAGSASEAFWTMTSYYRDGLAFNTWEKSLEAIAELHHIDSGGSSTSSPSRRRSSASASSALFGEHYKGSLRTPATILWGEKDLAITKTMCLDGIGDYLARASEVIMLPRTGHWTPVERESRAALAKVISLYAGNGKPVPLYVSNQVQDVYKGATCLIKK